MGATIVIGAQWGDEGKGKVIDYLSSSFDSIVRYNGGNNAGHTIYRNGKALILHLIPSGIMHPHTINVIANGVVVNPEVLVEEMNMLAEHGVDFTGRLFISERAHFILPEHIEQDLAKEKKTIGTTGRGIGPAYTAKISRKGYRMCDLFHDDTKIPAALSTRLKPYITDTSLLLAEIHAQGKKILFEGAQGTFLDVDHGTYPYVTSSNAIAGGACTGSGIGPTAISSVLGVMKAYTTRVGNGPFPTELGGSQSEIYCAEGDKHGAHTEHANFATQDTLLQSSSPFFFGVGLRMKGDEYGATTKRPRRVGWLDLFALAHAVRVNGITELAITKLDILGKLNEIRICTGYLLDGKPLRSFPATIQDLTRIQPQYQSFPSWDEDLSGVTHYNELPTAARTYLRFIEDSLRVPITYVSVGPSKDQMIKRIP